MLHIESGLTANKDFLKEIYNIEKIVYTDDLCGEEKNLYARYKVCNDSYLLVLDQEKIVGYINFFPICEKTNNEMLDLNDSRMRDDDIEPQEIHDWSDNNHIFIISIAILPEYRDGQTIILLSNAFLSLLRKKNAVGHKISSISGYAVSNGGIKFLNRCHASLIKKTEENYSFYYATTDDVEKLLEEGYF